MTAREIGFHFPSSCCTESTREPRLSHDPPILGCVMSRPLKEPPSSFAEKPPEVTYLQLVLLLFSPIPALPVAEQSGILRPTFLRLTRNFQPIRRAPSASAQGCLPGCLSSFFLLPPQCPPPASRAKLLAPAEKKSLRSESKSSSG